MRYGVGAVYFDKVGFELEDERPGIYPVMQNSMSFGARKPCMFLVKDSKCFHCYQYSRTIVRKILPKQKLKQH